MLLAGLLCQLRCFFFSLRGGAFSLARAGLEQTGCCVGAQRALCGRCPQEGLCRARVQVCGELVNEFFLTTAGQQLLMHQGKLPGCSSAVWSKLGVCVGERRGTEFGSGSSLTGFPPPLRPLPQSLGVSTFSMRLAFSAELSNSLCNLSLSLCSLAFSRSTVSIWTRWALPTVAWELAGPSTAGGLKELGGPWLRAAG